MIAAIEMDAKTHVDRLASIILEFAPGGGSPSGPAHVIGTCSMYQAPYQRIHVFGTKGRVEIEIPFNAPLGGATRVFVGGDSDPTGIRAETIEIAACNQYTIQADRFSSAILDDTAVALPLEDSVCNMRVLDALVRSAASGRWEGV